MKIRNTALLSFVIFLGVFVGCKKELDVQSRIQNVEKGLLPPVIISGESTWTIQERLVHHKVPGISIAVINDFKIEWSKGYGVTDIETKEKVTDTTLFQAASISKPVASMAALKMVQMGKIVLDENINDVLLSWKLPENGFTKQNKVSLKHLLNHSGGVTVHGFRSYAINEDVPNLIQVLNGKTPANSQPIIVDMKPETRMRYSGGGFCVMQQVLIDVEKKLFPKIMEETVLHPIGMSNSTYQQPLSQEMLKYAAVGHRRDGQLVEGKRHIYPEMAAAGLWTTPTDLAMFANEIQLSLKNKSNKVLSPIMTETMLTPFVGEGYGLGIGLRNLENEIYFSHGGSNEGFRCILIAHKDSGYGAVVMTNSDNGSTVASEIVRSIAAEYKWQNYLPTPYNTVSLETDELDKFTGRYLVNPDLVLSIIRKEDKLYGENTRSEQVEFFPISDTLLVRKDRNNRYIFIKNEQGFFDTVISKSDRREEEAKRINYEQKIPYEYLILEKYDEAAKGYRKIKSDDAKNQVVVENRLNNLGYELLDQKKYQAAIVVFKLNIEFYPQSANTYDSLGEAYMLKGDKELAIKYYKKTLELEPNNPNAVQIMQKLQN